MIRSFDISKMEDIHLKSRYYTLRLSASELGIQTVANMMNIIILIINMSEWNIRNQLEVLLLWILKQTS